MATPFKRLSIILAVGFSIMMKSLISTATPPFLIQKTMDVCMSCACRKDSTYRSGESSRWITQTNIWFEMGLRSVWYCSEQIFDIVHRYWRWDWFPCCRRNVSIMTIQAYSSWCWDGNFRERCRDDISRSEGQDLKNTLVWLITDNMVAMDIVMDNEPIWLLWKYIQLLNQRFFDGYWPLNVISHSTFEFSWRFILAQALD